MNRDTVATPSHVAVFCFFLLASVTMPSHAGCVKSAQASQVDHILVDKSKRQLLVLSANGAQLCEFRVALGSNPKGPKVRQGDNRTPEGNYVIKHKRDLGETEFHRGFYLSYPNDEDRRRAEAAGVNPGGDILIHGLQDKYRRLGRLHRFRDWTKGCIAVTNEEMDEMWPLIAQNTRVVIKP